MESIDSFLPKFTSTLLSHHTTNTSYFMTLSEETATISSNSFLCMLIAFYLKSSNSVILLSEKESLHHYASILRKFSINLLTNDSFCFVDIQSAYASLIHTEFPLSENYPYTYSPNTSKHFISCSTLLKNNLIDYAALMKALTETLPRLSKANSGHTVFILDYAISNSSDLNLLAKFSIDNHIPMISTINHEILFDKSIKDYYDYLSDIDIAFTPNESGHSKDIDGLITITLKSLSHNTLSSSTDIQSSMKQTVLRYSLTENSIHFFTHLII